MSYTLIITAYNPPFSPSFKAWVKNNISPSMVNPNDETEKAFFLQTIIDEFTHKSPEDQVLIEELLSKNVEYVEFS